ncbi:MAG: CHAT domain-containing tetratricopeptide repeat protein [Bacteroidales bacterium]
MIRLILSGLVCLIPLFTEATGSSVFVLEKAGNHDDKAITENKSFTILINDISKLKSQNNTAGILSLADSLMLSVTRNNPDSAYSADIYYYIGVCELLAEKYSQTVWWMERSLTIKGKLKIRDLNLAKTLFNLALSYKFLGDYDQAVKYAQDYIEYQRELSGKYSGDLAEEYGFLAGISFDEKNFEDFISYSVKALNILSNNSQALNGISLCSLYTTIGSGYAAMGDYAKGRIYLEEAENVYGKCRLTPNKDYINLINSLAITYGNLGLAEKESEYFDLGVKLAKYDKSLLSFNMINTYAIGLGRAGKIQQGKILLGQVMEKVKSIYGTDSRFYVEMLNYYAAYLLSYSNDPENALKDYYCCLDYLNHHSENKYLKYNVLPNYANALFLCGDAKGALEKVQELLFNTDKTSNFENPYLNPPADSLKTDRTTIDILRLKYDILWNIYSASSDQKALEAAASTSELMISMLDRMRSNISEEDSRLILGNRFREIYLNAIRDLDLCYRKTGKSVFLEKAFEFAEKSKVAGLLAATRELNAIQFNIPADIANLEKSLQNKIGYYNSRISREYDKEAPDLNIVSELKGKLLTSVNARDSLLQTFRKNYPGYYTLKYNASVPSFKDIPSIIGKNNNYLNYVVSDSELYIFLVNRKKIEMHSFKIDSGFLGNLREFRALLSDQSASANARTKFNEYRREGYDLYKMLIEPVRKSFISDNLIIAPDNILSYLPFETLLTEKDNDNDLDYRDLNYLMKDYNISYTYSATFMKELVKRENPASKDLVAFAPIYTKSINTDSLFIGRQGGSGMLYDLPEARQEAEYIAGITGGKSYLLGDAKESVFKKVAGDYNIIHLAMHTYLNDQNPMNSAMIFSQGNDLPEDGLLYTYEVYGIPMKAKMVVLSSCNTGNGILSSGEGILSLARGFLYSGCQSVVMSMWEIDDRSGTEVMKMFYDNLRQGKSKSQALKKSRTDYLGSASQLRSHPYFWASLVVYGENEPVYFRHRIPIIVLCVLGIMGISLYIYLRKRRYS